MSVGFNKQTLTQKLAGLDSTQHTIETLSQWCVFHHRHYREVVEVWDSEFRSAPLKKRVALLFLANDIMQNSKKESTGYIIEFMKFVPAALNEVFTNGDDSSRHVIKRLVNIWEDRKIFDIQGLNVKPDFFRKFKDLRNKLNKPGGEVLEKIVSGYKHVLNAPVNEDTLMRKCQAAVSVVDNLKKLLGNNSYLGSSSGSGIVEELQEQHRVLRNSIEQLKTSELLRSTLISHLKEALNEQELKMAQVTSQLEAAQLRYKEAVEFCEEFQTTRGLPSTQGLKKSGPPGMTVTFSPDTANAGPLQKGQSNAVLYSQEGEGGQHNVTEANVVAKLATVAASEEMGAGVLLAQANGVNVALKTEEGASSNKRQKLQDDAYISQPQSQLPLPPPPLPPFPYPDDTFRPPPPAYPPSPESPPPPLPTSMPPQIIPPPLPSSTPAQLVSPLPPIAGAYVPLPAGLPAPVTVLPYGTFPQFTPVPNFPMTGMPPGFTVPPNPTPSFQGLGGTFYGPTPYPAAHPPTDRK